MREASRTIEDAKRRAERLLTLVPSCPVAIIFDAADDVLPYDSFRVIRAESLPYVTGRLIEVMGD